MSTERAADTESAADKERVTIRELPVFAAVNRDPAALRRWPEVAGYVPGPGVTPGRRPPRQPGIQAG